MFGISESLSGKLACIALQRGSLRIGSNDGLSGSIKKSVKGLLGLLDALFGNDTHFSRNFKIQWRFGHGLDPCIRKNTNTLMLRCNIMLHCTIVKNLLVNDVFILMAAGASR